MATISATIDAPLTKKESIAKLSDSGQGGRAGGGDDQDRLSSHSAR